MNTFRNKPLDRWKETYIRFVQSIFTYALFLTPFGYVLRYFSLITGNATPGVYIVLEGNKPITAVVKSHPSFQDRTNWLISGSSLLAQVYFLIKRSYLGNEYFFVYIWIASLYGVLNVITAFFPGIPWNARFKYLPISLAEAVLLIVLVGSIAIPELLVEWALIEKHSWEEVINSYFPSN